MSSGSFKKFLPTNYLFRNNIYFIYINKQELALNNPQELIAMKHNQLAHHSVDRASNMLAVSPAQGQNPQKKWGILNFEDLLSVDYYFIVITPRSTQTEGYSTC